MMNEQAERYASRRVLVVEDEDRLRGILARYLRARGHDVIEASSGADARRALGVAGIDVLLLDINLSDETGWDVLRWLRRPAGPRPPPRVVVVSAVPPSAKRLEQFRPDAVLNKPFPIDAIARLVETSCQPVVDQDGWE
ncbi:MAG TPA: response regulator [Thermomicrobiales bacterium]|nr:response regulator [Thermomicrobiales bacterium]